MLKCGRVHAQLITISDHRQRNVGNKTPTAAKFHFFAKVQVRPKKILNIGILLK